MSLLLKLLNLTFFCFFSMSSISQTINESDFYTPPTNAGITVNITDAPYNANGTDTNDDSMALTNAITFLTTAPNSGGTIIIPAGNFYFTDIKLKSDIHILVNPNATLFTSFKGNLARMFDINADNLSPINNVSIEGDGGMFTVDLSAFMPDERVRFASLSNVNNFKISDILILDNLTKFPSISFNATKDNNGIYRRPDTGLIKNIIQKKSAYGYGIAQLQSVNNVFFKDLNCEGGVTLRLESGNSSSILSDLNIDNIFARNIICDSGQAAIQLQPHTDNHGIVDLRDITATDCEFGVKIDPGFVIQNDIDLGRTEPGSFNSASIIRNVTVSTTYKPITIRRQFLRFLPCQFRPDIETAPGGSGTDVEIVGFSLAPSENFAGNKLLNVSTLEYSNDPNDFAADDGNYKIDFSEADVTASGFLFFVPTVLDRTTDDYENCNPDTADGIVILLPNRLKNTAHSNTNSDPADGSIPSLSSNEFDFHERLFNIYPNPVNNAYFRLGTDGISQITIYNISGTVVKQTTVTQSNQNIDITSLQSGIYMIKIIYNNEVYIRKIVKK